MFETYRGYKIIQEIFTFKIMKGRVTCGHDYFSVEDAKVQIDIWER